MATKENESTVVFIDKVQTPIKFQFANLNYTLNDRGKKTRKHILKNVSGAFSSGKMTGILGPSGSGKTSLLNVLSGFKTKGLTGTITVNNIPRDSNEFRKTSAYIPQEFTMLPKLTCRETMDVAADLKTNVTRKEKNDIINEIMKMLKLQKCADTYVDKLSGGEKKRLSIGTELIINPPIMFFDEPTSGLDSASSIQVMTHLKELALSGRTIICVIHQPSSRLLELFDDIYVLSEGECIYSGDIKYLVNTFNNCGFVCPNFYNRADFVLEVASLERGNNLENLVQKFSIDSMVVHEETVSTDEKTCMLPKLGGLSTITKLATSNSKQYPLSWLQQFCVLMKRNVLCTIRDFHFVQLRFLMHILVGILLGTVFYNIGNDASKIITNASCLFFFILFIFFANAMPTAITFPLEAKVFFREHQNNWYPLSVYYIARIISDIPFLVIGSTTFIVIGYFMTGQPNEGERLLMVWGICLLTTLISQTIGLLAGGIFTIQLGVFLIPSTAIPMMIFSGFFIKMTELHQFLQPMTYISYFRYAFEGSVQAVYGRNRTGMECAEYFCYYRNGNQFLQFMGMADNSYWFDITILGVWLICLQLLLLIVLKVRLIREK